MGGRIIRSEPTMKYPFPVNGSKIKIGEMTEKGYPQSLDYFKGYGKYAGLFEKAYGDKPSTIQIVFPNDNAEDCCAEYYEYYNKERKLIATGDGETFKVWDGTKYKELSINDYPNLMESVEKRYPSPSGWKVTLKMFFYLPLVAGLAGCWSLQTKGGLSSIPQIRDTFDNMLSMNGTLHNVIFDLNVKYAKSQKPDNNSRFPVLTLVANESRENLEKIHEARKPIMIEG